MAISENTMKLMTCLQENEGTNYTAQDVADALGLTKKQVDGAFTSFQKKELGSRVEAEIENADGSHTKIKYLCLNDAGLAWAPSAE